MEPTPCSSNNTATVELLSIWEEVMYVSSLFCPGGNVNCQQASAEAIFGAWHLLSAVFFFWESLHFQEGRVNERRSTCACLVSSLAREVLLLPVNVSWLGCTVCCESNSPSYLRKCYYGSCGGCVRNRLRTDSESWWVFREGSDGTTPIPL